MEIDLGFYKGIISVFELINNLGLDRSKWGFVEQPLIKNRYRDGKWLFIAMDKDRIDLLKKFMEIFTPSISDFYNKKHLMIIFYKL